MSYSLNEVDAMIRKAGRGAGLPWGLAEDLGHYARLASRIGVSIDACFIPLLQEPKTLHRALVDVAEFADGGLDCHATEKVVDFPVLWVCAGMLFAKTAHVFVSLRTSHIEAVVSAEGASLSGGIEGLIEAGVPLQIRKSDMAKEKFAPPKPMTRAEISRDGLILLEDLAMRTYAPDTEASRLSGAGAGTHDND